MSRFPSKNLSDTPSAAEKRERKTNDGAQIYAQVGSTLLTADFPAAYRVLENLGQRGPITRVHREHLVHQVLRLIAAVGNKTRSRRMFIVQ